MLVVKPEYLIPSLEQELQQESLKRKIADNDNSEESIAKKSSDALKKRSIEPETQQGFEPAASRSHEPQAQQLTDDEAKPQEVESSVTLCSYIALNRICPYETSCKYGHDVRLYLEVKGPDIGPSCPNAKLYENCCPFGVRCRFYEAHPVKDRNIPVPSDMKNPELLNFTGRGLTDTLRKKKYQFERYFEVAKLLKFQEKECADKGDADDGISNKVETDEKAADKVSNETITDKEIYNDSPVPIFTLNSREKRKIDFKNKLYLAPLTTVGNLPFRRICKTLGADITCGEMALVTNLLKGHASEWALIKRHISEDIFGVQICGGYSDTVGKCVELLNKEASIDFIDINMGCPIDCIFDKGMGSALLDRPSRMNSIIQTAVMVSGCYRQVSYLLH